MLKSFMLCVVSTISFGLPKICSAINICPRWLSIKVFLTNVILASSSVSVLYNSFSAVTNKVFTFASSTFVFLPAVLCPPLFFLLSSIIKKVIIINYLHLHYKRVLYLLYVLSSNLYSLYLVKLH